MKKLIILLLISLNCNSTVYYKIVANSFQDNETIKKLSTQWLDFEAVGTWTKADSSSFSGNGGTFRMYAINYSATLMVKSVTTYNFLYNIGVKNENSSYPKSKRLHYTLMPTTYTGQVKLEDGYLDRFAYLSNQTFVGVSTTTSTVITTPSPIITITSPINTIAGIETVTSPIDTIISDTIHQLKDTLTGINDYFEIPYKTEYFDINGNKSDKKELLIEIKYYIGRIERRKIIVIE